MITDRRAATEPPERCAAPAPGGEADTAPHPLPLSRRERGAFRCPAPSIVLDARMQAAFLGRKVPFNPPYLHSPMRCCL